MFFFFTFTSINKDLGISSFIGSLITTNQANNIEADNIEIGPKFGVNPESCRTLISINIDRDALLK